MLQSILRLTTKLTRRGQSGSFYKQLEEAVDLPYTPLFTPKFDVFLPRCIAIQRLIQLPSNGLSGPVQQDKEQAYNYLKNIVTTTIIENPQFNIAAFDGINCPPVIPEHVNSLQDFSKSFYCRDARILSYKDFEAALKLCFVDKYTPITVEQVGWLNDSYFWNARPNASLAHFVCAQNYAHLRKLDTTVPVVIQQHSINSVALSQLKASYHIMSMPHETWSHPAFMSFLIKCELPYARLAISRAPYPYIEWLLLPRNHSQSNLLAESLLEAGAPDVMTYLQNFS